jgi:hypothetical protein
VQILGLMVSMIRHEHGELTHNSFQCANKRDTTMHKRVINIKLEMTVNIYRRIHQHEQA